MLRNLGLGRGFISSPKAETVQKPANQFVVRPNQSISVTSTAQLKQLQQQTCPVCLDVTLSKTRGFWTQVSMTY